MNSDLQTTDCFKFSKFRGTKNDRKTLFPEAVHAMMQGSQETENEELTKAKRQGREGIHLKRNTIRYSLAFRGIG